MKRFTSIILILFVVLSCNQSEKRVRILPYEVLNDNNSKVWILNSQIMNGEEITPERRSDKITLTLYKDQTFMVHLISDFATYSENNGKYFISENGKEITFQWSEDVSSTYDVIEISENKFEYKSKPNDESQQHLTFIPLDKPSPEKDDVESEPEVIDTSNVDIQVY